ncbi:MAG TPA: phospholipase D-like domain-containing protein [Verrucomicrobiae bacterium]|nr:phospholipase D-like domain-containing protein [Verrucomicrobiae bacterium]
MSAVQEDTTCNWLCTGDEVFPSMLEAIDAARTSVRLETYIYAADALGQRFRDALARACERGVSVKVLVDGLGSLAVPAEFWAPLQACGGEVRVFNPVVLRRMSIRNHRKLLVCDDHTAYVGGFNISTKYEGDGVRCGWCDLGLKMKGPLAVRLAASFDEMFDRAAFRHKPFMRLRRFNAKRAVPGRAEQILLSGPGRGRSPIKRALTKDIAQARDVKIIAAYFLPTWALRRALARVVRRGGRVQLILAGKSDVVVSQLAGRSLYRRFLNAGVEIFEYQPQILHAKLIIVDDVVYIGSANLDQRSLQINYELMIRFDSPEISEQARAAFANNLNHSQAITLEEWRKTRTLWRRIKQRWAYFLLVRVDPFIARWQWRTLPD